MIKQKYKTIVFSFFMSFIMSGVMSLVLSIFNAGIGESLLANNFHVIWLQAWLFSFFIALPTILVISPAVAWLTNLVLIPE